MNVKELFGVTDLPADVKMLYRGLIKKKINLKNGWVAIVLKNNLAVFLKDGVQMMSFGAVRAIFSADDGKFMVIKENKEKAIWDKDGLYLAPFSKETELYRNGWYRKESHGELALFDNQNNCLGQHLRETKVFRNGSYFMSVIDAKDGGLAGVYNKQREKLLFTNTRRIYMLNNGWFIADGWLHDNLGEPYIQYGHPYKLSLFLLICLGSLMPFRKQCLPKAS